MSDDLMFSKHEEKTFDICEFCRYNPSSSFGGKPCKVCPASGREIKTNADRIKAMSDEKLARWLCSIIPGSECMQTCPGRDMCKDGLFGLLEWVSRELDELRKGYCIKNRPYFVRADKWEDFLNHKIDEKILEQCKCIDQMVSDSISSKLENEEGIKTTKEGE